MESLKLKIYRKLEGLILENIKTAPNWSDQTGDGFKRNILTSAQFGKRKA